MSVQNLNSTDAWTRAPYAGMPARCFYCGEDIADVAVIWSGYMDDDADSNLISLHPDCATHLGNELIGDARNAQRILTGKSLTAGICPSLIAQGEA